MLSVDGVPCEVWDLADKMEWSDRFLFLLAYDFLDDLDAKLQQQFIEKLKRVASKERAEKAAEDPWATHSSLN